ncbi:VCBS repeat-containing protein [candidate division WOR-3 bacterium]|nr:VCBS repeat-containing protein [candidate division WOR-3 bacterium]
MCYVAFLVAVGFSISQVNWVKHIVDTGSGIKGLTQGFMPADMDGDEFADFVAHTNDTVVWYEDDGAWNFTKYVIGPADDGDIPTPCVYPCDLDNDGDMDVLVATAGLGLGWYKNESLVWSWCAIDTIDTNGYHRVVPADLNGDPYTDLVAVNDSIDGMYGVIYTFISDENQVFTKYRVGGSVSPQDFHGWQILTLDCDHNEYLDIYDLGKGWPGLVIWFNNDGTGTSFHTGGGGSGGIFDAGCLSNVDMEPEIEIIVGGHKGGGKNPPHYRFFYAETHDPSHLQPLPGTEAGTSPIHTQGVAGYDVNSDGFPDIVGVGKGKIRWFERFPHPDSSNFVLHEIDTLNNSYWVYADDIGNMCVTDSGAHIIYELSMLRMISPDSGENWAGGSTHNIEWIPPADCNPTDSFRLSYSTDSGSTYPNEIATGISYDSTSWEWTLPIMNCDSCRVKVELLDTLPTKSLVAEATSSFNFAIRPHVEILDTIVDPGDTVDIAIYLTDVTGLKDVDGKGIVAYDIPISFNYPLKALSAKKGSLLDGSWFFDGNTSEPGKITINSYGASELTGSGSLAIVSFIINSTALPGDTSMLSFGTLAFNEGKIPAHTIDGKATVSGVRVNISGDCHYWSNDLCVADVDMDLSGDHFNNVKTDSSSGHYSFPAASGANYTVTPSKVLGDCTRPVGAITAFDASLVLWHTVEYDTLTGDSCVAADVSGDGTIRAYDASLILRYVVRKIDSFPVGDWGFKPENTSYSPIVSDALDEDYTAILYGDVSGSWGESKCLAYKKDAIRVEIPRMFVEPGETVNVPVQIGDVVTSDSIIACEIILTFDSTMVTAIDANKGSIVPTNWTIMNNSSPGRIKIILASDSVFLSGSGELVSVPFVVDADVQAGDSTKIHFSDFMFNEYSPPADLHDGWLGVAVGSEVIPHKIPKVFFASQNCPNPFIGSTNIEYGLPKNAEVKINIYNLSGQKVATLVKGNKKAGYHQVKWDGKDKHGKKVATGIYFYRMEAGDFKATKKLTILK